MDRVSFSLQKGRIVGLLGPNGAGKTTTIQMLVGITLPDGGAIRYFGQDLHRHREACLQRINFCSSYNMLQNRITVWENLVVYARLYRIARAEEKIRELGAYFGVTELMRQRFLTLSAGQKTRVNLVKALLNDPDTYLHIAAGRWMLAHRALPFADPFSHSMPGASWVPHEWLAEFILGAGFEIGGT